MSQIGDTSDLQYPIQEDHECDQIKLAFHLDFSLSLADHSDGTSAPHKLQRAIIDEFPYDSAQLSLDIKFIERSSSDSSDLGAPKTNQRAPCYNFPDDEEDSCKYKNQSQKIGSIETTKYASVISVKEKLNTKFESECSKFFD